jgi:hypothetical protein
LYKTHGRLYSSPESLERPLIYRYESKLKNNFRVPEGVKFLIILPELDIKGEKSPSIKYWLEEIDNNSIIPRNLLHVVFFSYVYGIIPLELSSSFPMGQYESIDLIKENKTMIRNFQQKIELFFDNYSQFYLKCGMLIPEEFLNQFNETVQFSKKKIIFKLVKKLKSNYKLEIGTFKEINALINSFKSD